jgi:hypothetical protein
VASLEVTILGVGPHRLNGCHLEWISSADEIGLLEIDVFGLAHLHAARVEVLGCGDYLVVIIPFGNDLFVGVVVTHGRRHRLGEQTETRSIKLNGYKNTTVEKKRKPNRQKSSRSHRRVISLDFSCG